LHAGEAIALAGPGASARLWPTSEEFLLGLIGHTRQRGKLIQAEAGFLQKEVILSPLDTAQQLRNKLGDRLYFEYLQEVFSDKISPRTGEAFTTSHQALLQLPIQNYLTLNYDAGLTNARAYLYPRAVTSYYFWDQEEVRNILHGNGFKRLILHAHGRYDRTGSIILTLDDFRRAYNYAPFVRLLDNLFVLKRLIMVGFELNSPYIKQLLASISSDYKKSPLRHIALVGLDDGQMQAVELLREREEMVYGAQILFYPSRNNHETLSEWFNALAERYASTTETLRVAKTQTTTISEQTPANPFEMPVEKLLSMMLTKKTANAPFPELSQKQKEDYGKFDYQCFDRIYIPGVFPKRQANLIEINGNEIKLGDSLFNLFLRFLVELKKNEGGWVSVQDLKAERLIDDPVQYQIYSRLRTTLQGTLLDKDTRKFIQNDGLKRYRVSIHPNFVSYNKKKLLLHDDATVRRLAEELP
jgi:hypothetical protein